MTTPERQTPIGGVVHTYQKYNPTEFPSPTAEAPDMVSVLLSTHWPMESIGN